MNIRTRLLLLPVLLLVGACSSAVRQPEVRLESVRVGGIGLRGGTLNALVYVGNPNGFDLETRSITYDLQVEDPDSAGGWVTFSQGTVDETVRVEGNSSKVIEIPIQFRYDDLGGAVRSILDTGTFNYRVTGDVRLSEPIGRTFPYAKTGIVSMTGVRE
jgi:LEA14-like dessication related protein